jgi:hypothetical protein
MLGKEFRGPACSFPLFPILSGRLFVFKKMFPKLPSLEHERQGLGGELVDYSKFPVLTHYVPVFVWSRRFGFHPLGLLRTTFL